MVMLAGLVPVFLLLVLGVVARRAGLLDEPSASGLNRIVVYIALPALFIAKVGTSPLESALSPRLMVVTVGVAALATLFWETMSAWSNTVSARADDTSEPSKLAIGSSLDQ